MKLGLNKVPPGVPLVSSREISLGQELLLRFCTHPRVLVGTLLDFDDASLTVTIRDRCLEGAPEIRSHLERLEHLFSSAPPSSAPDGEESLTGEAAGEKADRAEKHHPERTPDCDDFADVEGYFLRQNDGSYRFRSRLLGVHCGGETVLQLSHPPRLVREQRRDYLRMPVHEDVPMGHAAEELGSDPETRLTLDRVPLDRQGTIMDLSGGGLRLLCDGLGIKQDDVIVLRLPFLGPPFSEQSVAARVAQVYREGCEFGLSFEDLPSNTVAAIMGWVEEVHRQVRSPGTLVL